MADLKNHERIVHLNGFSSQTENKVLVDKKVQYDKLVFSSDKNMESTKQKKSFSR